VTAAAAAATATSGLALDQPGPESTRRGGVAPVDWPRYANMMWRAAVLVLCACESATAPDPDRQPTQPPKPAPSPSTSSPSTAPVATRAPAPAPAAVTPDLQCYYLGPKEYIRLTTDVASMTGELTRLTVGPAPYRHLKVRVVQDGGRYNLIFDGYYDDDYKPQTTASLRLTRRERLTAGRTEIAELVVFANEPRILGTGLDLHTGMMIKSPDGSYPCRR